MTTRVRTAEPSPIAFERKLLRWGPWLTLLVFTSIALVTAADYGPTTDEPWRMLWSRGWWDALRNGEVATYVEMPERQYYGVLYDLLGRGCWLLDERWFGGNDEFRGRHLLNVVAGALALLGTHRLARRLAGERVALLAMVLLATSPRFYGSCPVNPKDIPFAAASVWAAWACIGLAKESTRRGLIVAGILAGVCAAVRPFGVAFFFLAGVAAVVGGGLPFDRRTIMRASAVVVLAYACCFVLWPVLWVRPPWHLITASADLTQHVHGSRSLFMGDLHPFWDAPPSYVVVWLAITVPPAVLVGTCIGAWMLPSELRASASPGTTMGWVLIAGWIVGPSLLPAIKQTTLYDTSRHLLFIVPPLCIVAALGWVRLAERGRWLWRLSGLAIGVGVAGSVAACIGLHPYQSLYFSPIVGGLPGARERFDVAHYSETYREGFLWLREHHPGAAVHVVGNGSALASFLGWKYGLALNAEKFEFFLSEVRQSWELTVPGEVVHTVARDGVPLLEIRRVEAMGFPTVGYIRPKHPGDASPPPPPGTDRTWERIEAVRGRFDIESSLHGKPGFLAIQIRGTQAPSARVLLAFYLGLTAWLDGQQVYKGQVVPFQYRGTENFPSLLPLDLQLTEQPQWLVVDVSHSRQSWKFGVYAPIASVDWPAD